MNAGLDWKILIIFHYEEFLGNFQNDKSTNHMKKHQSMRNQSILGLQETVAHKDEVSTPGTFRWIRKVEEEEERCCKTAPVP